MAHFSSETEVPNLILKHSHRGNNGRAVTSLALQAYSMCDMNLLS
jgi:hypothetical protein